MKKVLLGTGLGFFGTCCLLCWRCRDDAWTKEFTDFLWEVNSDCKKKIL